MPSFRIGFGSDFVLKDQRVGLGTVNPRATLDVIGTLKGDLSVSGVTTLTSYSGFVPQKQSGDSVTIIGEVNTISEDIIVSVGKVFTVSAGSTVNVGTLESVAVGSHFSVPNGGTSLRTEEPVEGMVRFNNDLNTLEFWNGVEWRQFTVTGASGRGVFGGGGAGPSTIDYVNIHTTGNALNFGTLTVSRGDIGGCASSIRGLIGGGGAPALNVIDYITIASEGNAIDFGDLSTQRGDNTSCSSSTRGVFGGGYSPTSPAQSVNVIDYVTISTLGNALDFGDLINRVYSTSGFSSPTRGIFVGGSQYTAPGPVTNTSVINLITIASTGNAIKFGDLIGARTSSSCSNSTRGIIAGGLVSNSSSYFKLYM